MLFTHSASYAAAPLGPAGLTSSSSALSSSSTTTTTTQSPSKPSRLRRFSHLRSYTPSHLLSRDNTTTTTTTSSSHSSNHPSGASDGLPRSTSDINSIDAIPRSASQRASNGGSNRNRLTLVNSAPSRASRRAANTTTTNNASNSASAVSTPPVPPVPQGLHIQNGSDNSDPLSTNFEVSPADNSNSNLEESLPESSSADILPSSPNLSTSSSDNAVSSTAPEAQSEELHTPIMTRTRASTTGNATAPGSATTAATTADFLPSIRLSAYYDPRSTRPSLTFPSVTRTLPTGSESIRVGRYSERDTQMSNATSNQPSAAPVGFKSKVVSRRHCEFWHENGKWFIKDVKSSSGTFLNHIRLSPPSQESKAFPVNDGDIIQLGIDFKGGEEMIFRCVKMRVELNRGWQNKLNTFNMAAHKRLRTMASPATGGAAGSSSQDCSICLNSIAPCQSLFVAPCSHTWHFKCVRSLLMSPQYPIFLCPNCRAGADLEADVEDPAEDWEQLEADGEVGDKTSVNGAPLAPATPQPALANDEENSILQDTDAMDVTVAIGASDSPTGRGNLPHATSEPLPIVRPASSSHASVKRERDSPSPPPRNVHEGPITPRNEVGPWVFDGSAGQRSGTGAVDANGMRSLDAAATDLDVNGESSDSSMR